MSELVSTNWVYKNINNRKLVILDCSWHMPGEKRNPKIEYNKGHIKNAFFFDIDKIANTRTKIPHMLPSIKIFERKIVNFGIYPDSIIVVYDTNGIFSSPRVWWMFKFFGHKNVYVLNGGLKKWLKEKKPITDKKTSTRKGNFISKLSTEWLIKQKDLLEKINKKNLLILDARHNDRFKGIVREPRKGVRSGHIPNSKNIFWGKLIKPNGTLESKKIVRNLFNKFNVKNKKIITSCGSGITACILSLSLLNGLKIKSSVYDGSWSEWGQNNKLPIKK